MPIFDLGQRRLFNHGAGPAGPFSETAMLLGADGNPLAVGDATAANQATQIAALGAPADAEAAGNGSIIAVLKRMRTLLGVNIGLTPLRNQYACGANVTPTQIAAGAGRVVGGFLTNYAAASRYIKLYDKATAPVVGADTPMFTGTAGSASFFQLGSSLSSLGLPFTAGLWVVVTVNQALADTTAPGASDVAGCIVTAS